LTISLLPSYTHGQLLLPLSKTRNHPSCAGGGVLRYPLPGLITSRVSDSWSSAGYRKQPPQEDRAFCSRRIKVPIETTRFFEHLAYSKRGGYQSAVNVMTRWLDHCIQPQPN
jgi:hypothetical protein